MNNGIGKRQRSYHKPKRQREVNMKSVDIHLGNIEDVNDFVNTLTRYECKFGLVSEHHTINPKSILGMFSLDLRKSMQLTIHAEEPLLSDALEDIRKYLVCD